MQVNYTPLVIMVQMNLSKPRKRYYSAVSSFITHLDIAHMWI